jgi:hypothetical protein
LTDLATALLPVIHRSFEGDFNAFDVMHHGTQEKQTSNVLRWLLETEGNHHLGDTFLRIFIEQVNRGLGGEPFAPAAPHQGSVEELQCGGPEGTAERDPA